MFDRFGPWSSALDDGPTTRLSTFWKRRLGMLATARSARPGLSRRDCLRLGAVGAAACALPTLHFAPAAAPRPDDARPPAGGKIYAQVFFAPVAGGGVSDRGYFAIDPATGAFEKARDLVVQGNVSRLSRDGRTLALARFRPKPGTAGVEDMGVSTLDARGEGEMRRVADFGALMSWSPDGKQLIVVKVLPKPDDVMRFETWRLNVDGSGATMLPIPQTDEVDDWSPDGRWLVTVSNRHAAEGIGYQLYVMHPDGTEPRRLTQGRGLNVYPRFSPDSRRIAYLHQEGAASLWIVNIDGSGRREVLREENDALPDHCCWSPDGRSLACVVQQWHRDEKGQKILGGPDTKSWIVIVDAEGKERRTLKRPGAAFIESPEWR